MDVSGLLGTSFSNVWRGLCIGLHRFEAVFFELKPTMRKPDHGGEGDQRVQPRENIAESRVKRCPPVVDGNVVEACVGDEIGVIHVITQQAVDAAIWRNKT